MNSLKQERIYTIEDIYDLPDGEWAELIDGRIYYMAPSSMVHQRLVSKFKFPAPFAVFLNKDDTNYIEPDISVICDPSKLDNKNCHGAPDWIIEIVSPSSKSRDYMTKLF